MRTTDSSALLRDMGDALDESDAAAANRKITRIHYRLGQALQTATGGPDAGANFHSWAVWGSRKAGVTIRQEDLDSAIRDAFVVAGGVGAATGVVAAHYAIYKGVRRFPGDSALCVGLGAICGALTGRSIAVYSRREASRLILAGNRAVLKDIGTQTIRFLEAFADDPDADDKRLGEYLRGFRSGATEAGGQDLLRQAFTQYYNARYARTQKERHESLYFANCLAVLHEHIRLQPYISGSMPFVIRKCVTKRMMTFEVGDRQLAVSQRIDRADEEIYPASLKTLDNLELRSFLYGKDGWDTSDSAEASEAARDWTQIKQRMAYIVRLFRAFHGDPAVLAVP